MVLSQKRIKTETLENKPEKLYIVAYKTLQGEWSYMNPTTFLKNARWFAKQYKVSKILKYEFSKYVKKEKKK
jgi:hypothetical protein